MKEVFMGDLQRKYEWRFGCGNAAQIAMQTHFLLVCKCVSSDGAFYPRGGAFLIRFLYDVEQGF